VHTEKSLAAILAETKEEITRFITTRVSMLKAETEEKVRKLKAVIPLIVVALALLIAGWMALTFALIALLHALFLPSIYSWLWAGLIVGGLYVAIGIAIGQMAIGRIKATSLTPNRTLTVLKQDKVWIQNEARTA
jgi:mannose/fructose/N-acetylgalactosamine-specific phosphotransferase system component IIC